MEHIGQSAAEAQLAELLAWAAGYPERDDETSRRGHRGIFNGFAGEKRRFTTRAEVAAWLGDIDAGAMAERPGQARQTC